MRVVVGIDGSAHGRQALAFAFAEARLRGVGLRVVHAWTVPPLTLAGIAVMPVVEQVHDELRSDAEAVLREELEAVVPDRDGVEIETLAVEGQPAAVLVAAAAGAELLVVGSRGHGSLVGAVLGSVSQQCLHHAPCPVAVVHSVAPAERRRIVVGVDGSAGGSAALRWAVDEARRRGTTVHAVCAYDEPWGLAAGGLQSAGALTPIRETLAREAQQVVEEAERTAGGDVAVSTATVSGSPLTALLSAAADSELLVVGSRGRDGFESLLLGSVSQRCAMRAGGAVVVVRGSANGARPRD